MTEVRQDVEALRLLSAFGIVWFHTQLAGAEVGYSGLVVFMILTMYFAGKPKSISKRAQRLLVPWAIWFAFYGILNIVTGRPLVAYADGFVAKLLWGPANHLWYLPGAFAALILFDQVKRRCNPTTLTMTCGWLAVAQLATAPIWRAPSLALGYPWATFVHVLPATMMGVFFAGFTATRSQWKRLVLVLAILACVATLAVPDQGVPYLIGILAASILLVPPLPALQAIKVSTISGVTLGVYLIHPFLLDVCRKFAWHFGALHPLAIFIASAVIVWVLQKMQPRLAKLVI